MRILISDKENFVNKLQKMHKDGLEHFKMIADFDQTLTRKHAEDTLAHDTFDIFTASDLVSQECKDRINQSAEDYANKVPQMSEDEKIQHLQSNIGECLQLIADQNLSFDDIKQIAEDSLMYFRDGIDGLLKVNQEYHFPFIITSAGVGDVIKAAFEISLANQGIEKDNIQPFWIISNMGEYKDDKLVSFQGNVVHPANKEQFVTTKETMEDEKNYEKGKPLRHNILLMGDVVDDLRMIENVEHDTVLKIGFFNYSLNDGKQELLEDFKANFDVIISGDGDLWPVIAIIQIIAGKQIIKGKIDNKEFTNICSKVLEGKIGDNC